MPQTPPDQRTPEPTKDGSMTLYSARYNQTYHSRNGAITESLHVFLNAGWQPKVQDLTSTGTIRVLELGLGTGLNALLTLQAWRDLPANRQPAMDYVALEPAPLSSQERLQLDMHQVADPEVEALIHAHPELEQHHVQWGANAEFTRLRSTWQGFRREKSSAPFDVIYFDAFAPDTQPELWSLTRFEEAFEWLAPGGVLVTYCAKGAVRRAMVDAGFRVERLPGPPGKREMLRATRPHWGEMTVRRFNVRVYFFLLDRPLIDGQPDPDSQVLLSDEFLSGKNCTKWPGGGLEFGEGPRECALREAEEELGQPIALGPLVHATGNFVRSSWRGEEQVLCQYYLATLISPVEFRVATELHAYPGENAESFRWKPLSKVDKQDLTFEVDQDAIQALKDKL